MLRSQAELEDLIRRESSEVIVPGEGPPLTIAASTVPGIPPLVLYGIPYTESGDTITMTRAELSNIVRAWTEHVVRSRR